MNSSKNRDCLSHICSSLMTSLYEMILSGIQPWRALLPSSTFKPVWGSIRLLHDSGWRAPLASVSGLGRLCFRAPAERFVCETHERRQGFPFRLDRTRPMPKTRADCSLCLCALQSVQREVEPAACLQSCVPISSSAKLHARWQSWAKTFDLCQPLPAESQSNFDVAGIIPARKPKSEEPNMLWTLFVILLVLWLLGVVSSYTLGGFIHILLVLAVVALVFQLLSGRRPVV